MDRGLGPNQPLIAVPGSRARLTTPALILDLEAFERNLDALAARATAAGMKLRPHAKTHKCGAIAHRQIDAGAAGICVATLREAEAMTAAGVPGVLVTSPVVGEAKIARLCAMNARAGDMMVVTDNPANVERLDAAAEESGAALGVLVDIDVGMQRTGLPDGQAVIALAEQIEAAPWLRYRGVQAYSGRAQHIEAYAERTAVYGAQIDRLAAIVDDLGTAGLPPEIVTGGGTGTHDLDLGRRVFTELQAGSYIFMDVQYNAVEMTAADNLPFSTALFVRNTVVSANAEGFVTIDGGFKCFATDGPAPEIASGAPAGATYEYFGDEHGRIVTGGANARLAVGDQVELVTPHCDPTVNLHDFYHCVRGDTLVDIWRIDARGVL